jgi:hypothetical protein
MSALANPRSYRCELVVEHPDGRIEAIVLG